MNHKRLKPRKSRGHCHMCKPYKDFGNSKKYESIQQARARLKLQESIFNVEYL